MDVIEPGIESGAAGGRRQVTSNPRSSCVQQAASMRSPRRQLTSARFFLAGTVFPGHTEFLAHLTGSEEYAMAFVAANLRIVLISTHVPLSEAIRLVQRDRMVRTIDLTHRELKRWGIERPRLAVAALNPHGAEGGLFGMEETSEIVPADRGMSRRGRDECCRAVFG